ncbi:hypothetical protein CHS0354_037207 [Potamilus streckersoni]|uniref:Uncharacterized protein n=1 Tax=Potamilus streckersoni TaxID=2493646 RepID=A0AAE0SWY5_9BIVA|nr:hypothetical protein CHS0354_037207 [Potamilus streckersoni]
MSLLKKILSSQVGRSCSLTKILLLSYPCLFVYFFLHIETLKKLDTYAAYRTLRRDKTVIGDTNLGPTIHFSRETEMFHMNDFFAITSKKLTISTIRFFDGIRFKNISTPKEKTIITNLKNPLLTLFTTWLESKDKYTVHNLTSVNWLSLRPLIIPVVFTNETSLAEECSQKGWRVLPVRATAAQGAPVLKYMYLDVMKRFDSNFYAFANSDILFTDKLVETLSDILKNDSSFKGHTLIIGKRTNVDNLTKSEGSSLSALESVSKKRGKSFGTYAEDYFITSASYPWKDIPDIVIGRRAYDNWLVLNARRMKHRVLDASETILAVHQTTKAGNFEGWKHQGTNYNHKLLVKLYKKVPYTAGYTDCAEFVTRKDKIKISITRRLKLAKHCNLL